MFELLAGATRILTMQISFSQHGGTFYATFHSKHKFLELQIRIPVVIVRLQSLPLSRVRIVFHGFPNQDRARMPNIHQNKSKEHGDRIKYVNKNFVVVNVEV